LTVVALGPLKQRLLFVVNDGHVNAFIDEVLAHLNLSSLDGVENRSLTIYVDRVWISIMANQALSGLHITLSNAVKDWCLPVSVYVVNITPIGNQVLYDFIVSLSTGIIERCLVQIINFAAANTHFQKHSEHFE
jgi:hypothetical protein